MFSGTDEKYEILYYKYSQLQVENKRLREESELKLKSQQEGFGDEVTKQLVQLSQLAEQIRDDTYKVKGMDADAQKLLLDISKLESFAKEFCTKYGVEAYTPVEKDYDPAKHDVATYQQAHGLSKGMILKTVRKGYKHNGKILVKPKVVVTQ
jgi:molecular chaperone GrpE (heat shock protein)